MNRPMNTNILRHNLGFPRIGAKRELKRALESFWSSKTGEAQLLETAKIIRAENWRTQQAAGIDLMPSNDFSLYDHVLDTCALVGAVPERFQHLPPPPQNGQAKARDFSDAKGLGIEANVQALRRMLEINERLLEEALLANDDRLFACARWIMAKLGAA